MTREEFVENWIDKYLEAHADEKIDNFDELREQADCEWCDREIEKENGNKLEFDLTNEQEKISQNLRKGKRQVDAYGKVRIRERKPNELKRDQIALVAQALRDAGYAVEVTNIERQIDLVIDGNHFTWMLTQHRNPKTK